MVLSFFRKGEGDSGFENITHRTVSMLADARHSFDLASTVLLSAADPDTVAADIIATDNRINRAEQELRGALVTHVAVHGSFDIAAVLGYTLLLKKIERIGDQAKNILGLAEEGVSFAGEHDAAELNDTRRMISGLMGECSDLLVGIDTEAARSFRERTDALAAELEVRIREFMHSDQPGSYAVPRAILLRYWKRIVANLGGILSSATEPLQHQGYFDEGATDIVDD